MEGGGNIALGSGLFEGPFSFQSRMENGAGTNPEELLGASLAGCYAMALNATLEREGKPAKKRLGRSQRSSWQGRVWLRHQGYRS
jgi:osmotically inducible protein OsmC